MRILTTIILCVLCAMQAVAQSEPKDIYTFDDKGEMVVNEKFIDTHVERDDSEVKPYTLIGLTTFEANSKKYELQVLNYKGWENDGGDFRIIRLYHESEQLLEFIDEEAWIGNPLIEDEKAWIGGASRDIYSGGAHFSEFEDSISKYATYTGHCLIYPLENKCTALLFNGFSWSSQVPLLTIILIKGDEAKVVFNQSWGIEIFKADDKGFDLTLMANYPEYVDEDNIPDIWYPDFHRLYTTPDGSMKFEKSDLDWIEYITKKHGKAPEDLSIYAEPDELPVFPGGTEALKTYLRDNTAYPDYCIKNRIEGRVIVQFVVNKDGSISNAEVVKSANKFLDKEAMRVISSMPIWEPGIKDERVVRVKLTLPIVFNLNQGSSNSPIHILSRRIAHMYRTVFADYNNNIYGVHQEFFSLRLNSLWNKLPDDEMVINADMWTWMQDFDSLAIERIRVDRIWNDSAWAVVTFSDRGYKEDVQLILVKEQHETETKDWYIEDFIHKRNASRSIQGYMIDYFRKQD